MVRGYPIVVVVAQHVRSPHAPPVDFLDVVLPVPEVLVDGVRWPDTAGMDVPITVRVTVTSIAWLTLLTASGRGRSLPAGFVTASRLVVVVVVEAHSTGGVG